MNEIKSRGNLLLADVFTPSEGRRSLPDGRPSAAEARTRSPERGERLRHYLYLEAHEFIRRPSLSFNQAWGSLGSVVSNAKRYVKKVKDKAIVLRNVETDVVKIVPYYTRFSDGYYHEAIKKMRRLYSDDAVFLTLTLDPRRFISLDDAYRKLRIGWNKLLTMLRKRYGKLQFVKVVEFQKSGSPHLHALFFGISRLIDATDLRSFWDKKYGAGTFVYLKRIKNDGRQVVAYLTKYIKKYLDMPEVEFNGPDGLTDAKAFSQLALAWALNLRAFSVSRGILDMPDEHLKLSGSTKWEFLGVFELSAVWGWEGLKFEDIQNDFYELIRPPD